jgi:hypothetical protein
LNFKKITLLGAQERKIQTALDFSILVQDGSMFFYQEKQLSHGHGNFVLTKTKLSLTTKTFRQGSNGFAVY